MTREELKEHCERQIQQFERVEKIMPVTPNNWKRYEEHKLILELLEQEQEIQDIYEKYSQIVELMDGVIMNPPPYCRSYKYTKKQKVYDTMYEIQRIIGKVRFSNEEKESD